MRITLMDIARKAGVSKATVSRALNNHPNASPQTVERIRNLAKEMGYVPSVMYKRIAQSRWTQHRPLENRIIAIIGTDLDAKSESTQIFLKEAQAKAASYGLKTNIIDRSSYGSHQNLLRMLYNRNVAGILLLYNSLDSQTPELNWHPFPTLTCGASAIKLPLHSVRIDERSAMALAFNRAHQAKCYRVGVITRSENAQDILIARWRLTVVNMRSHWENYIAIPPYNWTEFSSASLATWLQEHRIQALIGNDDHIYRKLCDLGYKIPEDFTYISMRASAAETGTIGGIRDPRPFEAQAAVRELHRMIIENEKETPDQAWTFSIDPKWVDGRSLSDAFS